MATWSSMALTKLLGTALCLLILVTPHAAADPAPADYWLSLINQTHRNPTGMTVVIVPHDVMSNVIGSSRQCLSNLNLQSLDEGYAWKPGTTWVNHDGETYMDKGDYEMTCLSSSEFLF